MIRGHHHVFDDDKIPDAGWHSVSESPFDPSRMAYYRVVTIDHTEPIYTGEKLVECKYCGTRHNIDKLDVLNCKNCGAPL